MAHGYPLLANDFPQTPYLKARTIRKFRDFPYREHRRLTLQIIVTPNYEHVCDDCQEHIPAGQWCGWNWDNLKYFCHDCLKPINFKQEDVVIVTVKIKMKRKSSRNPSGMKEIIFPCTNSPRLARFINKLERAGYPAFINIYR